jgi:hypothetical protein
MDDYKNDGEGIKKLAFMTTDHSGIYLGGLRKATKAYSHGSNLPDANPLVSSTNLDQQLQ